MKRRLAAAVARSGTSEAIAGASSESESPGPPSSNRRKVEACCCCCVGRSAPDGSHLHHHRQRPCCVACCWLLLRLIAVVSTMAICLYMTTTTRSSSRGSATLSFSQQETFSVDGSGSEVLMSYRGLHRRGNSLPPQCDKVAARFNACQKNNSIKLSQAARRSRNNMVVIACHQIWCNRWGHCERCSGIGDRTRILMSLIQDAVIVRCIPVRIDSPQMGLAMREDVIYHDGWWAEWFHYRSYDVSNHIVNVDEWPDYNKINIHHSDDGNTDNNTISIISRDDKMIKKNMVNDPSSSSMKNNIKPIFVHMTPDNYKPSEYDPCLLHLLFRPSQIVRRQVESFLSKIGTTESSEGTAASSYNMIGIHFRSGDQLAFGLTDYRDSRVSSTSLEAAVDKMILDCAQRHAQRLFPSSSSDQKKKTVFVFATDHQGAKQLAQQKYSNNMNNKYNFTLYTTDIVPQNYRQRQYDVQAWLELFILSKMNGLVMNELSREHYKGTAGDVSYFAMLAANFGFMNASQIYKCPVL